jgi:superfamily II DNA or RNA helicase
MSGFFKQHQSSLVLKQGSVDRKGFRICQLGAIWSAKSHFTASNERALINLPTGAGKTAVMMALAFEFGARRVFIVTPSMFSREQTANEFRTMRQLSDHIGALKRSLKDGPLVKENEDELRTDQDWQELLRFDVVVTTPNAIQSKPPTKLFGADPDSTPAFDLVFVDEAHHSAAPTWTEFLDEVGASRTVLFTATPFRRDRKRIRARPIYVYPISKAIKEGVYRPVKFVPVKATDPDRRDTELAEMCRNCFNEERKKSPQIAVIIKARDIAHANELAQVYKDAGLPKLGVIHSDFPFKENRDVLRKVAKNREDKNDAEQLNGFICVDMGSEGIDVPNLGIAVFHDTPQTLPYTIQVVGRITRMDPAKKGNAILIADPDSSRETEVQELYESDEGWTELLPELFQDYINQSKFLPTPGSTLAGAASLPADDLNPYQTVRVYQRKAEPEDPESPVFKSAFEWSKLKGKEVQIEVFDKRDSRVVVITRTWEVPRWTSQRVFETERFDLHIYCNVEPFVFEFTTSEKVAIQIRDGFWDESLFDRAGYHVIRKGLSDAADGNYIMVGMFKQSGADSAIPQYKTLMGEYIENAVKFADGRSFGAGHAMVKTADFTRGIATQSSRVWSNSRDKLENFVAWCDELAALLSSGTNKPIPKIGNKLMEPVPVTSYPAGAKIVSILFDDNLWRAEKVDLIVDGEVIDNAICFFKDWVVNEVANATIATLVIAEQDKTQPHTEISVGHEFARPCWKVLDKSQEVRVDIDYGQSDKKYEKLLDEYFKDRPPLIVFETGETIRDDVQFTPIIQNRRLDSDAVEAKDWTDTDITKEADPVKLPDLYNVQQRTELIIEEEYQPGPKDFLICDDRANEVADYILIQGGLRRKITFFHCKYKGTHKSKSSDASTPRPAKPGLNKKDLTELTEQAVRTGYWIRAPNLITRLLERIGGLSKLTHGSQADLEELSRHFSPDAWSYAVTLVQPGLSRGQLIEGNSASQAEQLLIVVSDRITDYGARFEVWASD